MSTLLGKKYVNVNIVTLSDYDLLRRRISQLNYIMLYPKKQSYREVRASIDIAKETIHQSIFNVLRKGSIQLTRRHLF